MNISCTQTLEYQAYGSHPSHEIQDSSLHILAIANASNYQVVLSCQNACSEIYQILVQHHRQIVLGILER